VGTTAGAVLAVNASDGSPGWTFTPAVPDGPVKGYVVSDRLTDDLYFATSTRLWSLSDTGLATFTHNWSPVGVPFTKPSTPVYAPGDSLVYVGGDGRLARLSVADGSEVDSFTLGDGLSIVGSPTLDLANGFAYVGTDAGVVYAIQLP
jgi:outer membrane protein assembly factor BamB